MLKPVNAIAALDTFSRVISVSVVAKVSAIVFNALEQVRVLNVKMDLVQMMQVHAVDVIVDVTNAQVQLVLSARHRTTSNQMEAMGANAKMGISKMTTNVSLVHQEWLAVHSVNLRLSVINVLQRIILF